MLIIKYSHYAFHVLQQFIYITATKHNLNSLFPSKKVTSNSFLNNIRNAETGTHGAEKRKKNEIRVILFKFRSDVDPISRVQPKGSYMRG